MKPTKKKPSGSTCNYCFKQMHSTINTRVEMPLIHVCTTPKCPAYGLLQITAEKMPKKV